MNGLLDWITFFWRFAAAHLLNGLILSAAVFLGSAVVSGFIWRERRWSAATRYQASLVVFLVVALTPFLTMLKAARSHQNAPPERLTPALNEFPPSPEIVTGADDGNAGPKHNLPEPTFWFEWIDWTLAVAVAWLVFGVICLCRVTTAMDRLFVLHRSSIPLENPPRCPSRRNITLAQSSLISSPVAIGIWSPKVLLPLNFDIAFTAQDQENVLRHEIAHLERFDDWWNLVQQFGIALFPLNPFLWLLRRRLRLLEEIACDDWALAGTSQPRDYANLLTRLATHEPTAPALASGVSRRGQQLYQRVARILDRTCDRSLQVSARKMVLVGFTTIGLVLGGLFLLPAVSASGEPPNLPEIRDIRPTLSSEVIALLKDSALSDSDAGVRREAVNALNQSGGEEATTALLALLNESKDEPVKLLILRGLTRDRVGEPNVKSKLTDLAVNEQSLPIRIAALSALARSIDEAVVEKFISIYQSAKDAPVKQVCLLGLAQAAAKGAKDFLMSIAKNDPDPAMRRVAVRALVGESGRPVILRSAKLPGDQFFLHREVIPPGKNPDDPEYLPFSEYFLNDQTGLQPEAELNWEMSPEVFSRSSIPTQLPKILARNPVPGALLPESPTTQPAARPIERHDSMSK